MRNACYILLIALLTMTSCYRDKTRDASDSDTLVVAIDSTRYYEVGYNFVVHGDSIILISQQPEEHVSQLEIDSFAVPHDQQLAVADIRTIPQDSIDSVWVQLISEKGRVGWTHESELLRDVVPTDPISQFIMFFSDSHIVIALIFLAIIGGLYIMRMSNRRNAPIVHFRDIASFYPSLLCIIVACSATFYASLQMFGQETWQNFYFHPTLNPFIVPPILSLFLISVWSMVIVGIATVDEVLHKLSLDDALLYLFGLMGVCSVLYIVFSISTLYYIGYPLLVAYCYYAIKKYFK